MAKKDLEKAIKEAKSRYAKPEQIISIEKIIIKEIADRILDGRSDCLDCDLNAITYHHTIYCLAQAVIDQQKETDEAIRRVLNGMHNSSK